MRDPRTQTVQETMAEHIQKPISEFRINNQQKENFVTVLKLMTGFCALLESFTYKSNLQ